MLLEWLLERKKPQAVGTLDVQAPEAMTRRPALTVLHGLVGFAMIGGGIWLAFQARNPLVVLSGVAIYLVASYLLHPRPNRENLGWAGGLIDHPFRWSDDQNRMLLFLQVVLFPGRFAAIGVRDLLRLAAAKRAEPKQLQGVVWERKE